MRVALAVISGLVVLATLAGAFKGLVFVLTTVSLGLLQSPGAHALSFLFLWGGTEGMSAIFCLLEGAGAGFVIAGRLRAATWLMLAGAVGVTASAVAYVLLQPVAMGPAFEPYLSPGLFPNTRWHAIELFPVPPLLLGAVLALLACGRSRSEPASC